MKTTQATLPPTRLAVAVAAIAWLGLGACGTEGPGDPAAHPAAAAVAEPAPDIDLGGEPLPPYLSRDNPISLRANVSAERGSAGTQLVRQALSAPHVTGPHGGHGGSDYRLAPEIGGVLQTNWRLAHIYVKSGTRLDSIELWWADPSGTYHYSGRAGGNGGYGRNIVIGPGRLIRGICGRAGQYVDGLAFTEELSTWSDHICNGSRFPAQDGVTYFGGSGGFDFSENMVSLGKSIHGVYGRSGTKVDSIGFIAYSP